MVSESESNKMMMQKAVLLIRPAWWPTADKNDTAPSRRQLAAFENINRHTKIKNDNHANC